jgi:hypothetical protein
MEGKDGEKEQRIKMGESYDDVLAYYERVSE